MEYVERPLNDYSKVADFFDNIDAWQLFNNSEIVKIIEASYQKENENKITTVSPVTLMDHLIYNVIDIHAKSLLYKKCNTMLSKDFRDSDYYNDSSRKKLRENIRECCIGCERNKDDNLTSLDLDKDGLHPRGEVWHQGKAFLLIGGPAAGKSTYANIIAEKYHAYLLDSDLIKRKIPEFYRDAAGASLVHDESKAIYEEILDVIVPAKSNIVTPIIGKDYGSLNEAINQFIKKGYDTTIVLVYLRKTTATRRALGRYILDGRYVPLNYVLDICGHEAVASFFKIGCINTNLKILEINNENRPGVIGYQRGCEELVDILLSENKVVLPSDDK